MEIIFFPLKTTKSTTNEVDTYTSIYDKLTSFKAGSAGATVGDEVIGKNTVTYLLGEPTQFNISLEDYYNFLSGRDITDPSKEFEWSDTPGTIPATLSELGKSAILVLNVNRSNTNDLFEGYYLGLSDNSITDPTLGYRAITKFKSLNKLPEVTTSGLKGLDYVTVPNERLDFKLASTAKNSISQIVTETIVTHAMDDKSFNDTLNIGLFKVRQSIASGDAIKLSAQMVQGINASIGYGRKTTSISSAKPVNYFLEEITEDNDYVRFFINPNVSGYGTNRELNDDGSSKVTVRLKTDQLRQNAPIATELVFTGTTTAVADKIKAVINSPIGISVPAFDASALASCDALYPVGLYNQSNNYTKVIGDVPKKVTNCLELITHEEIGRAHV